MELYILDKTYRRIGIADSFESLIWTDRFQETGDFELKIRSTRSCRNTFRPDVLLGMSQSDRVMIIEEVEDRVDDEGDILEIKGRSFELVFQNRILWYQPEHATPWFLQTTPYELPTQIFGHAMADPDYVAATGLIFDLQSRIPLLTPRFVPPSSFAVAKGINDGVVWSQEEPNTLYNELRKACLPHDLGFRVVRDDVNPQLYFEVYTGTDRTTRQQTNLPVIFSMAMDNIQNTREYQSKRGFRNVAYVWTNAGQHQWVGPPSEEGLGYGTGHITGVDRRLLFVQTNIPDGYLNSISGYLQEQGRNALLEQQPIHIFDGELAAQNAYVYNEDYALGDVVELRNRDGETTYKQVTEQIFVSDINGERSYPTLSIGQFEDEDTWKTYDVPQWGADVWEDFQFSQETWETYGDIH